MHEIFGEAKRLFDIFRQILLSDSEVCIYSIYFYCSLLNKFLEIMKEICFLWWTLLLKSAETKKNEAHCCFVGCFEWPMHSLEALLHHCQWN